MVDTLHKSNAWADMDYLRNDCPICNSPMEKVKKGTCRRRNITYETFCLTCQEESERTELELNSGPVELSEPEVNLVLEDDENTTRPETELEPTSWSLRPEVSSVEGEEEKRDKDTNIYDENHPESKLEPTSGSIRPEVSEDKGEDEDNEIIMMIRNLFETNEKEDEDRYSTCIVENSESPYKGKDNEGFKKIDMDNVLVDIIDDKLDAYVAKMNANKRKRQLLVKEKKMDGLDRQRKKNDFVIKYIGESSRSAYERGKEH